MEYSFKDADVLVLKGENEPQGTHQGIGNCRMFVHIKPNTIVSVGSSGLGC